MMTTNETVFAPSAVPAELLAQVGEAMATAAARMLDDPAAAAAELPQLESLGLQLQSAARVLAATSAPRLERVDLGVAALQARAEWAAAFVRRGAAWHGPERGCVVLANPPLLMLLLDLAVSHALRMGSELQFDVVLGGAPPLATVRIMVMRPGRAMFDAQPGDAGELHWALLSQLARHTGVRAARQVGSLTLELSLAFRPEGSVTLSPGEQLAAGLPATPMPAGIRVLLLEPHDGVRALAERLMVGAGLQVSAAATVDQARGIVVHHLPDCLVTGIATDAPPCRPFVDELRARQPDLRVLELVDAPHVFDTSVPGTGGPARLARGELERYLVFALAQELGTAR